MKFKIVFFLVTILLSSNVAKSATSTFTERTGASNPFNGIDVGIYSNVTFADIDNDGDYDAFSGVSLGTILFYENTGSNTNATFVQRTGASNPFNGIDVGSYTNPKLFDIDNDGDYDAFLGNSEGYMFYYENTGNSSSATFTERAGASNLFDGVDVDRDATIDFVDIDNDGDYDAFLGNNNGFLSFFENTGNSSSPAFTERTGVNNPFNGIDMGSYISPGFVDIDKDNDFDVFIGESGGVIKYFENTGNSSSPAFTERTGADNPFNGVNLGSKTKVALVDIDNDEDYDMYIGEWDGVINYFENTSPLPLTIIFNSTSVENVNSTNVLSANVTTTESSSTFNFEIGTSSGVYTSTYTYIASSTMSNQSVSVTATGLPINSTTMYYKVTGTDVTSSESTSESTFVTIPTLGEWGMIVFTGLIAVFGFIAIRTRIV